MRIFILILLGAGIFYSGIDKAAKQEPVTIAANHFVDPYAMIREGQSLLREGDLVVRLNQDPASQFIKNFNRQDKSYSHAGIVLFEKGYPYVYHIVNGEENPDEKLRRDSLKWFCNPRKNTAYGIFRYKIDQGEVKRLKEIIHSWYVKGVQFDSAFNLATDDRMYCSEMIKKSLAGATHNRISVETTKLTGTEADLFSVYLHLPVSYTSRLRIVSIDNLYKHSSCYSIKEYNYKPYP